MSVVTRLFRRPEMPAPVIQPVPTRRDPDVLAARERQTAEESRRRGRRAAIKTSPRGVTDPLGVVRRPGASALNGEI